MSGNMKHAEKLLLIPEDKYSRLMEKVKENEMEKKMDTTTENVQTECKTGNNTINEIVSQSSGNNEEKKPELTEERDTPMEVENQSIESSIPMDVEDVNQLNNNTRGNIENSKKTVKEDSIETDDKFDLFLNEALYTKVKPKKKKNKSTPTEMEKSALRKKWMKF